MLRIFTVLAAALFAGGGAFAQAYPAKPVRIIVPNGPGGLVDIGTRLVAAKLSETLGQQFIVDNRVGAGGTIGTAAAVQAAPDGYTLLSVFDSHATNPHLFKKLSYDTLNDLAPISLMVRGPMLLVAQNKLPATSVAEFVKLAKDKPGAINFLTVGPGSPARLLMELFKSTAGINVTMVPYKAAGPAMTDLVAGIIDIMFASVPTVTPMLKANKLRPLAITSEKRSDFAPGVPAMSEFYPGFRYEVWIGLFAPAKTPADLIGRVNGEVRKVLALPDLKANFAGRGLETVGSSPAELDQWLRFELDRWGKVIREGNITIE